jgi:hypothetical protein
MELQDRERGKKAISFRDMNRRWGRVDIESTTSKVDETLEETFPRSDPRSYTPAGVSTGPPSRR